MTGQTANIKVIPRDSQAHSVVPGKKISGTPEKQRWCRWYFACWQPQKNDINGANIGNWQTVLERIKGYVEKCIQQVQPKRIAALILS